MINLKMFNTVEDLCKLTGLSENELYDHGFDTDDWDAGFQSDCALTTRRCDNVGYEYDEPKPGAEWLVWQMDNYCIGYSHSEFEGKHYYMVHHA